LVETRASRLAGAFDCAQGTTGEDARRSIVQTAGWTGEGARRSIA